MTSPGIMNAVVLRPLNLPGAQNLYTIEQGKDDSPMQSYPDYLDLRDRNRSFDGMAAYSIAPAGLDTGKNPSTVWLYETSGNYFDVLAIHQHAFDGHGRRQAVHALVLRIDDDDAIGRAEPHPSIARAPRGRLRCAVGLL